MILVAALKITDAVAVVMTVIVQNAQTTIRSQRRDEEESTEHSAEEDPVEDLRGQGQAPQQ